MIDRGSRVHNFSIFKKTGTLSCMSISALNNRWTPLGVVPFFLKKNRIIESQSGIHPRIWDPGSDRWQTYPSIRSFYSVLYNTLKESSTNTSTVAKATMHRGKFFIRTFSGHCLLHSRLLHVRTLSHKALKLDKTGPYDRDLSLAESSENVVNNAQKMSE